MSVDAALAARWRRSNRGLAPLVWAHRGDSGAVTENTLAAFARAVEVGADGVEFDVRLDGDGTVVVFHDDDLRRLAGRPHAVEALPSHERKQVRLLGGHSIPTLVEALEVCGSLLVNVEIKSARPGRAGRLVRAVASVLAAVPHPERIVVSSFDPIALWQLARVAPTLARAYLFHVEQPGPVRRGLPARWVANACVHPDSALLSPESIAEWHRWGYAVNTWTVDDPTDWRTFAAWGVDGIFTNHPGAARAALSSAGSPGQSSVG